MTIKNKPTEKALQLGRDTLIANQKNTHIQGVLKQRLHEQVRIKLGLTDMPSMLARTLTQGLSGEPLSKDSEIEQVFTAADSKLLIVGQPGSGKTILLLELLESLLKKADSNPNHSIPVYVNLSSWQSGKSINNWLVERMHNEYGIAKNVGQYLLLASELIFLFDGLDEVGNISEREKCVDAINTFIGETQIAIAICSRRKDYDLLKNSLALSQAIEIQPLTKAQIQSYLRHPKIKLDAVYDTILDDEDFAKLAETPLILSLMALAFAGKTKANLETLITSQPDKQKVLFNEYIINRMRDKTREDNSTQVGTAKQQLHWLRHIATQLEKNSLSEFFMDEIQPSWLETSRFIYKLINFLVFGLILGLILGLVGVLGFGLGFGLNNKISLPETISFKKPSKRNVLKIILLSIMQGGSFILSDYIGVNFSFVEGSLSLVILTFITWIIYGILDNDLIFGLGVGLLLGLAFGLSFGLVGGLVDGLGVGLVIGLIEVLNVDRSTLKSSPNQGIKNALLNWIKVCIVIGLSYGLVGELVIGLVGRLVGGLFSGLGGGLVFGLVGGLGGGLSSSLGIGLVFGLGAGLSFGGQSFIQHYILRLFLAQNGSTPRIREFIPFLKNMSAKILLIDAGARFRFIHLSIQAYFADLSDDDLTYLVEKIER